MCVGRNFEFFSLVSFVLVCIMRLFVGVALVGYYAGCKTSSETASTNSTTTAEEPPSSAGDVGFRSRPPLFDTPQEYVRFYGEFLGNKTFEYMQVTDRKSDGSKCPSETLIVNDVTYSVNPDPFEAGSETSIYITTDESLIVKRVDIGLDFVLDMLWRDEAALRLMEDAETVSPVPLINQAQNVSSMCALRCLVMTNEGENTLYDYFDKKGLLDAETTLAIGRKAIRLVEQVHKRGLIHGDIHWGNFVYSNESDIPGSLRLIDYGRSMPYMDGYTGQHLPGEMMMAKLSDHFLWNDAYLSINELQGNPVGRRDDMFRLAEMLSFMMEGTDALMEKRPPPPPGTHEPRAMRRSFLVPRRNIVNRKRFRNLKQTTPKAIAELYYGSQSMELEDTPNYNILDMYS